MPDSAIRRLLEFDNQVQRDRDQNPVFLHRRDRRFALDCHNQGIRPDPDRWLEHVRRLSSRGSTHDPLKPWRRVATGFALAGLVAGMLAMLGLLFYDGGQQINLTVILAFVLLQCVLSVVTTVQAFAGWQPWRWVLKKFASKRPSDALRALQPLLMARAAHTGGLVFGVTGLITLLVLVVLQDLAFGWSTTLNTGTDSYYRMLSAIATPWQHLWPAAMPDRELVDATRFFRSQSSTTTDPALWGSWWPFVAMTWTTYVILPRLALFALAIVHPELRARSVLKAHHGWIALQYRMETPTVDTGNHHNDAADQPDTTTSAGLQPLPEAQAIIRWAEAGRPSLPQTISADDQQPLAAGGSASLEQDHHVIELANQRLSRAFTPAAIIVTRSWEPPTGELADFIQQARHVWPTHTIIALVPMAPRPDQAPPDHQLSQWLRFAERTEDERMMVSTPITTPPDILMHRALQDDDE
jgi:hypothetical protein